MAVVDDLIDGLRAKQSARQPWEETWLETARYALPDAERFDTLFITGQRGAAIDTVVSEPVAARRGKEIFDQTSLWAIDRGANGTMSLVTPQAATWHDLASNDPFAPDPTDAERLFYQTLRDYLFTTRADPRSGYWVAHKAAIRSMWAFGTGVRFTDESARGIASPISYAYVPLSENHLDTNFEGVVDTNYRLFKRSARQLVEWAKGKGVKPSPKVIAAADDPKRRDETFTMLHVTMPRQEAGSRGNDNRTSAYGCYWVMPDEKFFVGESGYYEFPFIVYHWQRNNPGPYAEGPMALALADVKSLNMLAKDELRGVGMWVNPPYATHSATARVNLNPRAVNNGLLTANGELLVKPIATMERPDFVQTILEAKRNQIRTTLYIDLWQSIINSPREQTAYEAMLRNQEKADLLGPVGTSLQMGLSFDVDREVGILARKGAFEDGSPLAPPDSLRGRKIGVKFTSPLDKMRRTPQLQGMTQLAASVMQIANVRPEVVDKIDWDALLDEMKDILDVPQKIMTPAEVLAQARQQRASASNVQTGIAATTGAGQAAEAAGKGIAQIANNPASINVLQRLAGVAGVPGGA
jgi:hypothetical protein